MGHIGLVAFGDSALSKHRAHKHLCARCSTEHINYILVLWFPPTPPSKPLEFLVEQ